MVYKKFSIVHVSRCLTFTPELRTVSRFSKLPWNNNIIAQHQKTSEKFEFRVWKRGEKVFTLEIFLLS
jgi:hypothetical protein